MGFVHVSESADIKEVFQMARGRGLIDSLIGPSNCVASVVSRGRERGGGERERERENIKRIISTTTKKEEVFHEMGEHRG